MIACARELEGIVRDALLGSRFEVRDTVYTEKEMQLFIVNLDEKEEYKLTVVNNGK